MTAHSTHAQPTEPPVRSSYEMKHIHEVSIAKLVCVSNRYREIIGWNHVEALNFSGLYKELLKLLLTVMIKANLISITAVHVYDSFYVQFPPKI